MTEQDRISRLEGAFEQVNERLGDLNSRMDTLQNEMNSRFNQLSGEMNSRFNQILGFIGVAWITLLAAIIAVLFVR